MSENVVSEGPTSSPVSGEVSAPVTSTPEVATSPVAEAAPVEKVSSSKLLELAKKESEARKGELEHKAALAKAQEELAALRKEREDFEAAKNAFRKDPNALFSKLGIGYDDITNAVLEYYDNSEKAKEPVKEGDLRKVIEEEINRREMARIQSEQAAAIENFAKEINTFVQTEGEKYPHLVKLHDTIGGSDTPDELLFNVISETYNATGQMLTLEEAAKNAEEYFREEWGRINGILNPVAGSAPAPQEPPAAQSPSAPPAPMNIGDGEEVYPSYKNFQSKDYSQPTINNGIPVRNYDGYQSRVRETEDVIEAAVRAAEEVRRQKFGTL